MVDAIPPFDARLDAALAMNGMDNAAFAAHFGPNGQQMVNGWRRRGRIGTPSVPKARALLPKTNIDWLQEGVGNAERLSDENFSRVLPLLPSHPARLDLHILARAVEVTTIYEGLQGRLSPLGYATRLMDFYDRLASGVGRSALIAQILESDEGRESSVERASGDDSEGE